MSSQGCAVQTTFPASLEAIEPFFAEFRELCQCLVSKSERFVTELLLREALTNAVLHGCNGDPERQVHCSLRIEEHGLEIVVSDDGEGFDWSQALGHTADLDAVSGRGFEIMRQYATQVKFNDKGNVVSIRKQFS